MVWVLKVLSTKKPCDKCTKFRNLGRLISGILIDTPFPIKIIGDKSYQKETLKE